MSILDNKAAMAIIEEAAEKLQTMGLACWVAPSHLSDFGLSVSLLVGETELAAAAAFVALREGSAGPHLYDEKEREHFAHEVSAFISDAAEFKASGQII